MKGDDHPVLALNTFVAIITLIIPISQFSILVIYC